MDTTHRLWIVMLGLLFMGCAGITSAPTREARQALAPTGKLRVGLQLGSPHNVIRDTVSGDMKGVGFDLGRELARRMGVPFEPITYPSVGALLDAGKAGAWDVAFVGFSPARAKEWDFTALHMEVNSGISSLLVLPSRQRLMWIGPGLKLPCKKNPSRISLFLAR
jgi:polar amino acid transport system substrate-binding protein